MSELGKVIENIESCNYECEAGPLTKHVGWHTLIAAAKRAEQAEAEVKHRESYDGFDGCSTGDCPHSDVNDCLQSQAKTIAYQAWAMSEVQNVMQDQYDGAPDAGCGWMVEPLSLLARCGGELRPIKTGWLVDGNKVYATKPRCNSTPVVVFERPAPQPRTQEPLPLRGQGGRCAQMPDFVVSATMSVAPGCWSTPRATDQPRAQEAHDG